jgi:hypothetical protein
VRQKYRKIVMTDKNHKHDMRHPEKSDATKAAEKRVGEAPFFPERLPVDAASQDGSEQGVAQELTANQ